MLDHLDNVLDDAHDIDLEQSNYAKAGDVRHGLGFVIWLWLFFLIAFSLPKYLVVNVLLRLGAILNGVRRSADRTFHDRRHYIDQCLFSRGSDAPTPVA